MFYRHLKHHRVKPLVHLYLISRVNLYIGMYCGNYVTKPRKESYKLIILFNLYLPSLSPSFHYLPHKSQKHFLYFLNNQLHVPCPLFSSNHPKTYYSYFLLHGPTWIKILFIFLKQISSLMNGEYLKYKKKN